MENFPGWQKKAFLEEMDSYEEARELLEIFQKSSLNLLSEIEKALKEGNLSKARDKAHSLKGACATIFFEEARLKAYEIEKAPDLQTAQKVFTRLQKLLKEFLKEIANF